ncbi:hypothetical protein VTL71DRAFT_1739 [Oculimacula yallundae]|uniref:Uncharacterized protein n=1 Tax=Oculimacula yallundae TaxID=86028 RepID=A0ABR4CC17_9HELO
MSAPHPRDEVDWTRDPLPVRQPGGWLNTRVSITETWAAVRKERKAAAARYYEKHGGPPEAGNTYTTHTSTTTSTTSIDAYNAYNNENYNARVPQIDTNKHLDAPALPAFTYKEPLYTGATRFTRPTSSGSDSSAASTVSNQPRPFRRRKEYPFVKRWLESNTLEEYRAACAAAAAEKAAEFEEEQKLKEQFAREQLVRDQPTEEQHFGKYSVDEQRVEDQYTQEQYGEEFTGEQNTGEQYTGEQYAEQEHIQEDHTGEQHAEEQCAGEEHIEDQAVGEQDVQEQHFEKQRVNEPAFPQQTVEEQRTERELSDWNLDSDFDTELTVSSRLNVRYMPDESPRDTLRKLSRVLSQSPAPRMAAMEWQPPKSPEAKMEIADPVPEKAPTLITTETNSQKSPEKVTVVQNPAPKTAPIPEPVPVTLPRAVTATIEDSTLDAFESFQEQTSSIRPTTFEQYFAMQVAERERLIDEAVRVRMNDKLNYTKHGLREAKRGIGRLDDFISSMPPVPATPTASKPCGCHSASRSIEEPDFNNTLIECSFKIKSPQWSQLYTTTIEPRTTGRFAGMGESRNWKFTWLGLILAFFAFFATWFVAESAMCAVYCHPKYASKNTWHPSDPFFPWAIPTKLDQWTGKVASGTARKIKDSFDNFRDPEGLRYKWKGHPKNAYLGANDWWGGKSHPAGYYKEKDVGIETDYEVYD